MRTDELKKRLEHLKAARAAVKSSMTCIVLDRRDRAKSEHIESLLLDQIGEVEEILERRGVAA